MHKKGGYETWALSYIPLYIVQKPDTANKIWIESTIIFQNIC